MVVSSSNRLHNEMTSIERESDKCVQSNKYYVIKIVATGCETSLLELGKKMVKDPENQPLFVYAYDDNIYAFFSCSKDKPHYLGGSHQDICSTYSCNITKILGGNVKCNIFEFSSQNQVYTYLVWKNTHCYFLYMAKKLEISYEEAFGYTLKELISKMKEKGLIWADIPKDERFGVIYRLRKKKDKISTTSISNMLDSREKDKYIRYLFG